VATSGTYIFNPDLAEIVDDAYERCRIDPALLTVRHILAARRSMRFMLSDWATDEFDDFRIQRLSFALVDGTATYSGASFFPSHVLDVVTAFLRRDGIDTPVDLISRRDYDDIPDKSVDGRVDRIFLDKQRDGLVCTTWPVPDSIASTLYFEAVLKFQDHDTAADTADVPYHLYDAFCAGLAARLAEKFAPPELEEKMYVKAAMALRKGRNATREMREVRFSPNTRRNRR